MKWRQTTVLNEKPVIKELFEPDVAYLLHGTLGLEEDAPAEQLGEDAADRPDVDGGRVVLGAHQDLGRPVVLRDHLLRHVHRLVRLGNPRQAKVTHLQTSSVI